MKRAQALRAVVVQGRSAVPIAVRNPWLRCFLCGDSRGGEVMRHVQVFVDEVRTKLNSHFDGQGSLGSQGSQPSNRRRQAMLDADEQEQSDDDSQGSQSKRSSEPRATQEFIPVEMDGQEIMASLAGGTGIVVGSDRATLQNVMTILQKRIESHSMPELKRRKSRLAHDEGMDCKEKGLPIRWSFRGGGTWEVRYTGSDGKIHHHSKGLKVPLHDVNGVLVTEEQRKKTYSSCFRRPNVSSTTTTCLIKLVL